MNIRLVAAQFANFLSAGDVPQADSVVTTGGCQTCAVGAESQTMDPVPVRQDSEFRVRVGIPEAHIAVERTSGKQAAVRAIGYSIAFTARQNCDRGMGRHVPKANRSIIAHTGDLSPVGAEHRVESRTLVPCQDAGRLPGGNVPEAH